MKKSEIKDGINQIKEAIKTSMNNIDEYLQPFNDIV